MKPTRTNRFTALASSASSLTCAVFMIALVASPMAHGLSGTWTQTVTDGLWSVGGNWSSGTIADGSGFTANFSTLNIAGNNTVHMDAPHTLTALSFTDTTTPFFSWILDNNGSASNILTLAGTTPTITVGTSTTATISAVIAGSTSWSKAGVGGLILSGDNTYAGTTAISASGGIINIQHANALGATGAGNGTTVVGGTTLQLQGGVNFAAETLSIASSTNNTVNLQNVSGDNTWNGAITTTGTAAAARISSDSGLLTLAGEITGASASTQLVLSGAGNITISGKITGSSILTSGSAVVSGSPGIRTLSNAANDFTGQVRINAGTLSINSIKDVGAANVSAVGAPTTAANGAIIIGAQTTSGTLIYTGTVQSTDRTIQIGTNTATPVVGDTGGATIQADGASNAALTFSATTFNVQTNATSGTGANRILTLQGASTGANTISGRIQNNLATTGTATVGITKGGTGNWVLSGDNTFSGATNINEGTLNIQHINALGTTAGGTSVANGAALRVQGGLSFAAEALTLTAGTATAGMLQNVSGSNTWNGTITTTGAGNFSRIASDSGLLTLANANAISSSGTTVVLQGNGAITVSGKITGTSGLLSSATGAGIRTLSGVGNDFTGSVAISGGTLSVSSIKDVNVASSLGKQANATTATISVGGGTSTGTLSYTGSGDTSDRVINLGGTTGGAIIDQSGASGNLKFTSALTATGLGSKTLTLQGSTAGTGEMGGAIVDSSGSNKTAVTKSGSGTWTLSGASTYTGATTISGGTLALGAAGSIESPTIIVGVNTTFDVSGVVGGYSLASAQTLSGTGTVAGAMSVSGTLSPGNSPGTMTTGSQTWQNGGFYNWQVLDAIGAAGTGFDTIAMTGTLDLSNLTAGGFGINLWSLASIGPDVSGNALNFDNTTTQSWNLLTASVAITGFDLTNFVINTGVNNGTGGFSNALGGGAFALGQAGNNLVLTFTAVPEPSTAALLGGLGVLGLLRRRRS